MAEMLDACARELLEVMPLVMQDLRRIMRGQSSPDLRVPELRSLAFLRLNPGSNLTDLAEYIGVSLPSMSKLVDTLTYRGYIDRRPDATDRRRICLDLTESGGKVLRAALEAVKSSFAGKLSQLGAEDLAAVSHGLQLLQQLFTVIPSGAGEPHP